jgi:hypothetical protein
MNFNTYLADVLFAITGAIAVVIWPGAAALLSLPLMGIPLAVLVAAMLGAAFSYMGRKGELASDTPARLLGIATDAFLGGWVAVLLLNVPQLEAFGFKAFPVEAVAGIAAYMMRVTRRKFGEYFERLFQAALNVWAGMFGRGKNRGEDTP